MSRLTIDQVRRMMHGSSCWISPAGRIFFSRPITSGERLSLSCTTYSTEIGSEELPDYYLLAAQYFILQRYYAGVDVARSNYYRSMFDQQWAKIKSNRLSFPKMSIGDDL